MEGAECPPAQARVTPHPRTEATWLSATLISIICGMLSSSITGGATTSITTNPATTSTSKAGGHATTSIAGTKTMQRSKATADMLLNTIIITMKIMMCTTKSTKANSPQDEHAVQQHRRRC